MKTKPRYQIHLGDCRRALQSLPAERFDSLVTDAPYEMNFMGQAWDRSGVAFDPATWAAAYRVLKPGAHLLAFGGTRTEHRMVCAIEDAGFEIRDKLLWLYGTGYPKNMNISKQIDARAGASREVISRRGTKAIGLKEGGFTRRVPDEITAPATILARMWDGWGTALKPAWEPIVVARKPLREATVVDQVLATGTGALNIEACRVPLLPGERPTGSGRGSARSKFSQVATSRGNGGNETSASGRWPANVLMDEAAGAILDEAAGVRRSGYVQPRTPRRSMKAQSFGVFRGAASVGGTYGDTGGASRFFYCPKVSEAERAGCDHPTMKPIALMRWLCRLATQPGGLICDPFIGSGSTIIAALQEGFRIDGIEIEKRYIRQAHRRIARFGL